MISFQEYCNLKQQNENWFKGVNDFMGNSLKSIGNAVGTASHMHQRSRLRFGNDEAGKAIDFISKFLNLSKQQAEEAYQEDPQQVIMIYRTYSKQYPAWGTSLQST